MLSKRKNSGARCLHATALVYNKVFTKHCYVIQKKMKHLNNSFHITIWIQKECLVFPWNAPHVFMKYCIFSFVLPHIEPACFHSGPESSRERSAWHPGTSPRGNTEDWFPVEGLHNGDEEPGNRVWSQPVRGTLLSISAWGESSHFLLEVWMKFSLQNFKWLWIKFSIVQNHLFFIS